MDIQETLLIPSLRLAKVVAGKGGLRNAVNGIMVLEAADIENWGHEGEIILTSYFALKDLSEEDTGIFFQKLSSIGISAIIIKIERLLSDIPHAAVSYCDKFNIPLIRIPGQVKYEAVILEIMGPLIDQNVSLLNRHYEVHNKLTRMALEEPSIPQILNELKKMIACDITLLNQAKGTQIGTNFYYDQFEILTTAPVFQTQYMNFTYYANEVRYLRTNNDTVFRQISVSIPNLERESWDLIIHSKNRTIDNDDFMVIENVVSFLQMELLKQYSISQNIFHRNNSLVTDLLNGRVFSPEKLLELLAMIHLDRNSYYQIMMIRLFPVQEDLLKSPDWAQDIIYHLRRRLKQIWMNTAFLEKPDRITFITNCSQDQELFTKEPVLELLRTLKELPALPGFSYQAAISTLGDRTEIPKLNQEVLNIQKILSLFHQGDTIFTYDDLGIYKIFIATDNLEHLAQFIPPTYHRFKNDYPELWETLAVFLEYNQNFSETAAFLYLHPKTIRYRINRIIELLDFSFSNAEQILQVQIASRLFKLMN